MNLRDLRYLVALAEHKHFGRAAEASFVSQPTLSTQIRKLEEELGVQLIERLIDEARSEGYKQMRLDTFPPKMGKAVGLYESHGFRTIPPYYNNPHEGVLFMELDLEAGV